MESSDPTLTPKLSRSGVDARHSRVVVAGHERRHSLSPVVDLLVPDHIHRSLRGRHHHHHHVSLRSDHRGCSGPSEGNHRGGHTHDHRSDRDSPHDDCRHVCRRCHGPTQC